MSALCKIKMGNGMTLKSHWNKNYTYLEDDLNPMNQLPGWQTEWPREDWLTRATAPCVIRKMRRSSICLLHVSSLDNFGHRSWLLWDCKIGLPQGERNHWLTGGEKQPREFWRRRRGWTQLSFQVPGSFRSTEMLAFLKGLTLTPASPGCSKSSETSITFGAWREHMACTCWVWVTVLG